MIWRAIRLNLMMAERDILNQMTMPFVTTAAILLVIDHWPHFSVSESVLLGMIGFALFLRLSSSHRVRSFIPHSDQQQEGQYE